mgnify:CR=1 FL=1
MNAIIYFSLSKDLNSKRIASTFDGDIFELVNNEKKHKSAFLNMLIYGFKTISNKDVDFEVPEFALSVVGFRPAHPLKGGFLPCAPLLFDDVHSPTVRAALRAKYRRLDCAGTPG